MEQLPPELMQIICSFLQPVPDLLRLSRVSRRWYASCASASLWRHVTVSSSAFPSSSERRSAWNRFAKRLGRAVSELHITLPRTLRLSEHHHPLTRSSFARCAGLREICSVCQNHLGDAFYVCKIPACVWTECEECRLNASLPLSLGSLASLSSLTFDRDGPWCWGLPCCGLSLQEKALRTVRTSKLRELSVMGVPVSGHSGIEKWFVRQRGLERLSLYIASGCVLDLCTAFWSSLRELCLFASDSVSWNIIGVMHLISVDCPLLEQLSVSFASAGTFPIYNLSALSRMRSFHMLSRQESAEIDGETLDYIFRSLDMRQLETLELKGIPALTEPTTLQLVLAQHPSLRRLTLEAPRVTRDQLLTIISNAPGLEALSLSGDCTEPFPALDLPRPPDFSELSSLPTSALRFVRLCTPMTERTVWALGMLPRLEELDIQAPCWLRAQLARSYSTHGTAFPALRRVRVAAQPVPTRVHVSDEFLASLLPLMRALERLELAGLHSVTGVGWLHAISETNPQLSSITCSGGTAPLYRSDPRTACSIPLLYPTVTAGRGDAHTDADHMESEPA